MRLVGLVARLGERGAVLAPAAVVVLRGGQPLGGAAHRLEIRLAEGARSRGEPQQDLPGVERHRDAGGGVDQAALEASLGKLDGDEPVEHAPRARRERRIPKPFAAVDERRDDVAGGLGIRRRPAVDEREVSRHAVVAELRAVLRASEPGQRRVHGGVDPRIVFERRGDGRARARAWRAEGVVVRRAGGERRGRVFESWTGQEVQRAPGSAVAREVSWGSGEAHGPLESASGAPRTVDEPAAREASPAVASLSAGALRPSVAPTRPSPRTA